jgi:triacylglycerol lipase
MLFRATDSPARDLTGFLLSCFLLPALLGLPAAAKAATAPLIQDRSAPGACVIVLHGLGRTRRSMNKMAATLTAAGYLTFNLDYPSRRKPIDALAEQVIPEGLDLCRAAGAKTIHFVTHSLGGIVVRTYLSRHPLAGLGRVVMLSPPNQGSEAVDCLRRWRLFRWYFGPAGQQLGTGPDGIAPALGAVDFPLGIITGNRPGVFDAWLSNVFPGPNDGKVSLERAKVRGMADFLVLPYGHTFIMNKDEVITQTLYFLRQGRFLRPDSRP